MTMTTASAPALRDVVARNLSVSPSLQLMLQIDEMQGDDTIRQARKGLVQAVNVQLDRCVPAVRPLRPRAGWKALLLGWLLHVLLQCAQSQCCLRLAALSSVQAGHAEGDFATGSGVRR